MAKKFLTKTLVLITIALIFSFCKKDEFSISAKKILLTETIFTQAVLKVTDDNEFTLMGYNNDQKLMIIKYNMLLDETDSKTVNVPASFAVSDFMVTEDGYLITSNGCITKINNNQEVVWSITPQAPVTSYGNNVVADSNGDAWLNGTTQYVSLLKLSSEGVITVMNESELLGYQKRKIYWSYDEENLVLANHRTAVNGFTYFSGSILLMSTNGEIVWNSPAAPPSLPYWFEVFPLEGNGYFVFSDIGKTSAGDPNIIITTVLDSNGDKIYEYKIEERQTDDNYEGLSARYVIDDINRKVSLVWKNEKQQYDLYFFSNEGSFLKKAPLTNDLSTYDSVQGFISSRDHYTILKKEDDGTSLILIPKNQF